MRRFLDDCAETPYPVNVREAKSCILGACTRASTFGPHEIIIRWQVVAWARCIKARDPRLQRNVALKILRETNGHDPLRQTRLLFTRRAASALNHPNILVVYDVGTERDVLRRLRN
mgnify:CR=1 FL=1